MKIILKNGRRIRISQRLANEISDAVMRSGDEPSWVRYKDNFKNCTDYLIRTSEIAGIVK